MKYFKRVGMSLPGNRENSEEVSSYKKYEI